MAFDDFAVNSDYPMDIVAVALTGTMNGFEFPEIPVPGGRPFANASKTITTSLPFSVLPFGQWSLDNGTTWHAFGDYLEVGTADLYFDTTTGDFEIEAGASRDDVTLTYRVFGFLPSDSDADVPPPSWQTSVFRLNSDFGYSKLVAAGKWAEQANTTATLFTHNLGYKPQVIAWEELNGIISMLRSDYLAAFTEYGAVDGVAIIPTATAIQARVQVEDPSSFQPAVIHYRIYGDDNG